MSSLSRCILGIAMLVAGCISALAQQAVLLDITGVVGPAMTDYVTRELKKLDPADTRLVILRMNTPGGLDISMREIISAILASPIPVATYVAPSGARAASAGTYIAYACPIAAMAPGTNIGAATPVALRGMPLLPDSKPDQSAPKGEPKGSTEPPDAESRKAINDAVAYIRGLAELNGRNVDWAVEAVRSAASLPASEALKLNVIDVIADDIPDLLRKIDGRSIKIAGKPQTLATVGTTVVSVGPGWRTEILSIITNPNIAFILMLVGVYGLIFEFLNPGAVAPGLFGGISLLVALFALNLLPINYAGAALVLLGIALMVAEAHIGSFGAIGVGGIIAFVIGAIIMFPPGAPGFTLSLWVVAAAALVTAAFFLLVVAMLLRSRKRPVVTGNEALAGAQGETVAWEGEEGRVLVQGEVWRARAAAPLAAGARVRVIAREGLMLVVEKA